MDLPGLFDFLANLKDVTPQAVLARLPKGYDLVQVDNYLTNRLIYPGFIPVTAKDSAIDWAILGEAIKLEAAKYYDHAGAKMVIPASLYAVVPDLKKLAGLFIDSLSPKGVVTLVLKTGASQKVIGSLLKPDILAKDALINLTINSTKPRLYKIKVNSLYQIPIQGDHADLHFVSNHAKLLGQADLAIEVKTGAVGIIVDTRI